jgi:hypothetical protein
MFRISISITSESYLVYECRGTETYTSAKLTKFYPTCVILLSFFIFENILTFSLFCNTHALVCPYPVLIHNPKTPSLATLSLHSNRCKIPRQLLATGQILMDSEIRFPELLVLLQNNEDLYLSYNFPNLHYT